MTPKSVPSEGTLVIVGESLKWFGVITCSTNDKLTIAWQRKDHVYYSNYNPSDTRLFEVYSEYSYVFSEDDV